MKILNFIALIFSLLCFPHQSTALDFYVSRNGIDSNPGSKEKPVATLDAARNLVRKYKSVRDLPSGGITIWIGEGQYDRNQSFVLNETDSGEPDAPITWRANKGESVRITGGISVPSDRFKKISNQNILKRLTKEAAQNVYQLDLKGLGISDFGQEKQYGHALSVPTAPLELFVNGEVMPLAHYPNTGYLLIGKVIDKGSVPRNGDYTQRGGTFEYTDQRHALWAGQKDIWLKGTFNYGYADDNILLDSVDVQKKQVKLAMPHLYGLGSGHDFQHYVANNILDELDIPGEWYLDRNTGILYFWPPSDIKASSIMVSQLEDPIICLEGASHVTLRDITVEVGRGIGIYMERSKYNLIAGCTVKNVGTSGIFMGQGALQTFPFTTHDDYEGVPLSRRIGNVQGQIYKYTGWDRNAGSNNGILSCDIYNTGCGGVYLSGGSKRKLIPGNNYVENCRIHDYSRRNHFLWSGINIDGCGNRISHCEIFNSDFQGIYVHGNDHLFEYNNIHDVTLNSDDTSPWYYGRDPSDRGNIVRYNYFHNCGNKDRMNMGIYCDDSSCGVLVYGNVFYKMNTTAGVLYSNSGRDLKMINNVVIDPLLNTVKCSAHYFTWAKGEALEIFSENGLLRRRLLENVNILVPPYSEKYPELTNYLMPVVPGSEWEGMRMKGNVLSGNLIVRSKAKLISGDNENIQFEDVNNYMTDNDPGFVDFAGQNFNFKPDAEVFQKIKGFVAPPFDKMGLYPDEYRKKIN